MKGNAARWLDGMAFGNHDSRLDELTLACLAFRESRVDGRTYLEAYGVDLEGELVVLAPPRVARATAVERTALFASLLLRGLRARGTILVEHTGCEVLRRRIEAAWGARAVFLDRGPVPRRREREAVIH
jgi:hypothetical protein